MKRAVFLPLVALAIAPHVAFAEPPKGGNDPAAAESLFYSARTLMQQNRYAEACPKLEESLRLDPGLGTQFNLADCNEHIGKVATAWAGFLEVAAQSKATNQAEREKVARKRASALEPRLPKLVVEVSSPPQGIEVKRDGIAVGAAAWGTAIPVDPGVHRIVASAPGKQKWETTVATSEGKTARVAVPRELPAAPAAVANTSAPTTPLGSAAPPPTPTTSAAASPATDSAYFPPPVVERPGSTQRTVGWIVMGAGAIGVGVGAGFGLASIGKRDEARNHCSGDVCDASGVSLRDDAIRNGNISTIATIAGGASVLGGIILVLTAPKGTEAPVDRAGKIRALPNVATGGGGFTLQGVFQ